MRGDSAHNLDRLRDLLADSALQPLRPDEDRELERLLGTSGSGDTFALEVTAAAIGLALEDSNLPAMPAALRERVEADAVHWLVGRRGLAVSGGSGVGRGAPRPRIGPSRTWGGLAPWLVAAACVVLAIIAWQRNVTVAPLSGPGSLATARARFLETAPDVQRVPWAHNTAGVIGDVVWSSQRQEGYVLIQGLAANDPAVAQYQIWIQDGARAGEVADRIDGGVFDVPDASCELIVPIHPTLPVAEPGFFAVTRERPGGVIVSDLSEVVLTAPTRG